MGERGQLLGSYGAFSCLLVVSGWKVVALWGAGELFLPLKAKL